MGSFDGSFIIKGAAFVNNIGNQSNKSPAEWWAKSVALLCNLFSNFHTTHTHAFGSSTCEGVLLSSLRSIFGSPN